MNNRKVGRPSKYDPKMCTDIMPLFEQGKSLASVAKFLGISRETMNVWRKDYQEFSDAILEGIYLSQAWWEEAGQNGLFSEFQGPKINSQIWMLNMKNRFGEDWRDKQELEIEDVTTAKVTINLPEEEDDG